MTISYAGSLTIGDAIPLALTAQIALGDAAGAAAPDVQARISGLLALSLQPPPTLDDLITGALATFAALQQMLSVPLPDVGATAAALAELQAQLAELNAGLAFAASFGALLGTAGIHYFVYEGRADALSAELAAHVSAGLPGGAGPAEHIAGCILLANDGNAISALQTVLRS